MKSRKYYIKDKYTTLLEIYQKWYHQQKGNSWEEFNAQITKNYLPNIIKPVKEIKIIKMTLVDIKDNLKEQAQDWRENQSVLIKTDSQKLLPLK